MKFKHGQRSFQSVAFEVGVPRDIGWAVAIIHSDMTVERTCKGCGASVRTDLLTNGMVMPAAIFHNEGCTVLE